MGEGIEREHRTRVIARLALQALRTGSQIEPFTMTHPGFDLAEAYEVTEQVRELRARDGEHVRGRKIGFTNRAVWRDYGISGPIWNYVYDTTVHDLAGTGARFDLAGLSEPRIEPEIVLHLARQPEPTMSAAELRGCVDWVAHGFEIVASVFPHWRFTAQDAAAAFGVHAALLIGERRVLSQELAQRLDDFAIDLVGSSGEAHAGIARNVLGSPFAALRFLAAELERFPSSPPLRAGEIVTTGTLTTAPAARAGETWRTRLTGIDLPGLELTFR